MANRSKRRSSCHTQITIPTREDYDYVRVPGPRSTASKSTVLNPCFYDRSRSCHNRNDLGRYRNEDRFGDSTHDLTIGVRKLARTKDYVPGPGSYNCEHGLKATMVRTSSAILPKKSEERNRLQNKMKPIYRPGPGEYAIERADSSIKTRSPAAKIMDIKPSKI